METIAGSHEEEDRVPIEEAGNKALKRTGKGERITVTN